MAAAAKKASEQTEAKQAAEEASAAKQVALGVFAVYYARGSPAAIARPHSFTV